MDEIQIALADYCAFYKSVYGMTADRKPSDEIIADDEELDKYLEDLYRQDAQRSLNNG